MIYRPNVLSGTLNPTIPFVVKPYTIVFGCLQYLMNGSISCICLLSYYSSLLMWVIHVSNVRFVILYSCKTHFVMFTNQPNCAKMTIFVKVRLKQLIQRRKTQHRIIPPFNYQQMTSFCDKFHHHLHSTDVNTCIVPRTRTRFGDRSFPAASPWLWNSLLPELRRPDTELVEFRRSLKTFLFA